MRSACFLLFACLIINAFAGEPEQPKPKDPKPAEAKAEPKADPKPDTPPKPDQPKPAGKPADLFKGIDLNDLDNVNLVLAAIIDKDGWPQGVQRARLRAAIVDRQLTGFTSIDVENLDRAEILAAQSAVQVGKAIMLGAPIRRAVALLNTPNGTASVVLPMAYVRQFGMWRMEGKQIDNEALVDFINSCSWESVAELKQVARQFPNVSLSEQEKNAAVMDYLRVKATRVSEVKASIAGATTYVLKDGRRIKAMKVMELPDGYSIKDDKDEFITVRKADVADVIKP